MKKAIYTLLGLIISLNLYCQPGQPGDYNVIIDFEKPDSLLIINNTHDNVWEIGKPGKCTCSSAHSGEKAIMTDTIDFYPSNNKSAFQITITDTNLIFGKVYLGFWHKYNVESGKDGGYIELSFDNGKSWENIVNYYNHLSENMYSKNSLIFDSIPAFSGYIGNWTYSELIMEWIVAKKSMPPDWGFGPNDTLLFRFTFLSDSIDSFLSGWAIDDIYISVYNPVENISKDIYSDDLIKIYPNPINQYSVLEFNLPEKSIYDVEIIEITGRVVQRYNRIDSKIISLNNGIYSPGIYYVCLINTQNNVVEQYKKFIVK